MGSERHLRQVPRRPREGATAWTFYEGPPDRQRHARHPPRRGPRLQGRLPAVQDHAGLPGRAQGRLGLPRPARSSSPSRRSSASPASATSRRYGVAEFNAKCRESVLRNVDAFEEMTERMGYWVDMDDPYQTMTPEYVESVWWALKQIHDKGLLVEDYRVAPYCPRCGTGLSDHELAQGYETVTDPSVYVRFPLTSGPYAGTAVAARLDDDAVDAGLQHRRRRQPRRRLRRRHRRRGDPRRRRAAVAQPCSARAGRSPARCRAPTWSAGSTSVPSSWSTSPQPTTAAGRTSWCSATTSPPRTAPAWCTSPPPSARTTWRSAAPTACPWSTRCGPTATSRTTSPLVGGQFFKHADTALVSDLEARGLLFRHVAYEHSYPHCWRCHTALLYYAQPSWYVRTTAAQGRAAARERGDQLVPRDDQVGPLRRLAQQQHRLGAVARRYWGTPLPIWRCDEDHQVCVGSLAELGRAHRHRPVRARPAPAVRRRRHLRLPDVRRGGAPRARRDRRVVRLAARCRSPSGATRTSRGRRRSSSDGLPRRLHLRGDRPDPRLVLHADGGQHAGLRPERRTRTSSAWATSWPRTAARCPSTSATSSSRSR